MRGTAKWAALALAAVSAWGQGGFSGPGRYEIRNIKSGKVLDLDRNDQSTVIQYSSRSTDNQTWEARPAGGEFFYLINAMNGYALDAGRGGRSDWVRGVPFNGSDSQKWRFEEGKDGNVLVVSRLGRALDIPDGTDRDGQRVQIYDPNGDSNQRFSVRRVSGRGGALGGGNWGGRAPSGGGASLVCASNNGERVYCDADTRNGVTLSRQISGTACVEGRTWGYDNRGVWVDRGCRAEFTVNPRGGGGFRPGASPQTRSVVCASNNGERVYCEADTRGADVRLIRQISGSRCREGETWGSDRRGIWVDRGCRAEFSITR
ncbi:MAG: DUF3011 domain-containing protein [Acidobacteria bacterium]|nr:DUF3011 domain-containing protein [Acidobacteriota bacterium]